MEAVVKDRTVLAAAVLSMAAGAPVLAERFNFSILTNRDGLPQRQVMAIAQDGDGYLWVGTYGGLSRFNGRTFRHLRTTDGLSNNTVQDIVPAAGGELWVGTAGGGVCRVRFPTVLRCHRAPKELLSDDVMDLESDGAGGVWVGTFAGITHLAGDGHPRHFPRAGTEELRNVWAVRRLGDNLYAGHQGGLVSWTGDDFAPVPTNLPRTTVRAFALHDNGLWVASEAGLYRFPRGVPGSDGISVLPDTFVQDLVAAGSTLWVATRNGLVRFEGGRMSRLGRAQGLEADTIHRVVADREGNLWLGTDEGLVKLVPGPITTFTVADGLPHPFVRAITGDAAGRVFVGTRAGIAVVTGSRVEVIAPSQLPGPRVYALLPLWDGSLWAGTSGGVAILRGTRIQATLTSRQGLPSDAVYALAADDDGTSVWIATWSGLALVRRGTCLPLPPEVASLRALALQRDSRGDLWVALRDGGLARLDRGWRVTMLRARDGLTDQVVWSMARQGDGLWFATNGDGALHLTPRGVERWDTRRGLADNFVWQALADRRGRLWLYTSQGLDVLEEGRFRHFDQGDGLPDLEGSANAAFESADGTLWFGTAVGLVRYDPRHESFNPPPPPIRIEGAWREDGGSVASGARLPARPGAITITLTSLSFRNEGAIRFSYRLLPVQPQWSPPTREGDIRYASLGGGRYRFEAVAVGSDGSRSATPAILHFTVALPFWRTPIGWALTATAMLLAAWGWARWRIAASEGLTRRLEQEVAARTAELAEKQEKLAYLAATDELTGLPNRRRFFEVARQELQRLSRSPADSRLALILLDLDGFKAINDALGHTAGDAVLLAVGSALAHSVRSTDTAARFGGDEFAVILPMTDRQGALQVADKLIATIGALRVPWGGRELAVGASAGLAVVAPSAVFQEQEVVRFVQRADLALYAAKRHGGGRVLDDSETWA